MLGAEPRIVLTLTARRPLVSPSPSRLLLCFPCPASQPVAAAEGMLKRWPSRGLPRGRMEVYLSCGGRAVLPDRERCQSSCALEVALEAAAPDVRMAAIAQKTPVISGHLLSLGRYSRLDRSYFLRLFSTSVPRLFVLRL